MAWLFGVLSFFVQKHLRNRGFLEQRHRENWHDFAPCSFGLQFFADDGHQDVDADRDPYLRLHRIFSSNWIHARMLIKFTGMVGNAPLSWELSLKIFLPTQGGQQFQGKENLF